MALACAVFGARAGRGDTRGEAFFEGLGELRGEARGEAALEVGREALREEVGCKAARGDVRSPGSGGAF